MDGQRGGYYEFGMTEALMFSLSADMSYSGGYIASTNYNPDTYQKAFAKLDATARISPATSAGNWR